MRRPIFCKKQQRTDTYVSDQNSYALYNVLWLGAILVGVWSHKLRVLGIRGVCHVSSVMLFVCVQILNYYRTGKLHYPTDVCGPLFEEEQPDVTVRKLG